MQIGLLSLTPVLCPLSFCGPSFFRQMFERMLAAGKPIVVAVNKVSCCVCFFLVCLLPFVFFGGRFKSEMSRCSLVAANIRPRLLLFFFPAFAIRYLSRDVLQ